MKIQKGIATLKEMLASRQEMKGSAGRGDMNDCDSSSDESTSDGSEEPIHVIIGEPVASLLSADGSKGGEYIDNVNEKGQRDVKNGLK